MLDLQAMPAWEVDGIETLAHFEWAPVLVGESVSTSPEQARVRDCVYGAATAPACPYWHFPKLVAAIRFERTTFWVWARRAATAPRCKKGMVVAGWLEHPASGFGRLCSSA